MKPNGTTDKLAKALFGEDNLISNSIFNTNLYRSGRANRSRKVRTIIRPDMGLDPTTASGYVEISVPIKDNKK